MGQITRMKTGQTTEPRSRATARFTARRTGSAGKDGFIAKTQRHKEPLSDLDSFFSHETTGTTTKKCIRLCRRGHGVQESDLNCTLLLQKGLVCLLGRGRLMDDPLESEQPKCNNVRPHRHSAEGLVWFADRERLSCTPERERFRGLTQQRSTPRRRWFPG